MTIEPRQKVPYVFLRSRAPEGFSRTRPRQLQDSPPLSTCQGRPGGIILGSKPVRDAAKRAAAAHLTRRRVLRQGCPGARYTWPLPRRL